MIVYQKNITPLLLFFINNIIMRQIFLLLILSISFFANSQSPLSKRHIQVYAGTSFNGTGDIKGFAFDTEYGQYFKKKSSWYVGIGGTIHDKVEPIFYTDQGGNQVDASVRATTAGFQVSGLYGHSFVRKQKHEFLIKAGPLVRYQSTSYWDILAVYHPAGTGLPFPVVAFFNLSPQRTLALGGNLEFAYNYTISKKVSIGILAELQTDTNGDTISQLLFSIGRRF
jgi:hypothetical protein